jgi:NADP-dependent 3-hydroxy acid dehydrogenase YdfG
MDINGASAIVTGGASGLGEATAKACSPNVGPRSSSCDLDRQQEKRRRARQGDRRRLRPVPTSPTTEQIIAAVEAAKELGPLKALVNCAGIGWATRTIGKDGEYSSAHDLDIFKKVIEINLIGTFDAIRLAATAMSPDEPDEFGERGAIVNTASVAAFDGQIGQASYSASKGGVVGMTLPGRPRPVRRRHSGQHDRPGPDRHPDLRRGRGVRAVQGGASRSVGAVPAAPRQARRSSPRLTARADHQQLHERAETIRLDGGIRMQPKS